MEESSGRGTGPAELRDGASSIGEGGCMRDGDLAIVRNRSRQ